MHEIGRIDDRKVFQNSRNLFQIGRNKFYDQKNKILIKILAGKRFGIGIIAESMWCGYDDSPGKARTRG